MDQRECFDCEYALLCGGGCLYQKLTKIIKAGKNCPVREEIIIDLQEEINTLADDFLMSGVPIEGNSGS